MTNAIPLAESFRSIPSLNALTNALGNPALAGITAVDSGGTRNNFAGDSTKLYKLTTATYGDVSKLGGYTVDSWEFAKFGDRIIAVSIGAAPQYYDMGVSALFADLPGTPPKANHIAIVRDFVVLGDLNDGGTNYPNRIQWSGFNNSEEWGVNLGTQADFQDLFGDGGKIQRIVPGEYGVIFQESSIWRMRYSGPPTIFSIDEVERGRGTPAPGSVCWQGQSVYFWDGSGFYMFDGASTRPIGAEKVDRHIKSRLDTSRYSEMRSIVDRRNNLVFWSYPVIGGGKEMAIYNWVVGEWGNAEVNVQAFTEYGDSGYTLDDLDAILADIDSASISVDSPEYQGGAIKLAAFNSDNKLSEFTGNDLVATISTGEMSDSGRRMFVQSARPIVDGQCSQSVALGTRNKQCDQFVIGPAKSLNSIGEAQFHKDSRYIRFDVSISGGFSHAQGVEVFYKPAGRR